MAGLKGILADGALRSSRRTGRAARGQGEGIYKANDFVYMHATDALFDPEWGGAGVALYLDADVLRSRKFYASKVISATPADLAETTTANGIVMWKRAYPRFCRRREAVLRNLYRESKAVLPNTKDVFCAFNQVAVRDHLDVRGHVRGILLGRGAGPRAAAYMARHFPDIEVSVDPE